VSLADADNATANMLSVAFKKEITMSRSLGTVSRNIVHMFDFDFDRRTGLTYMIMELGQQDLEHFLIQKSRLSPPERKAIWRQLVNIALALYNRNIVRIFLLCLYLILFYYSL
jgi:serine/threonine protein kinase